MLTMAEPDITQSPANISQKHLKPRFQTFINEYLISQNASDAARKAGYSAKTAAITGFKLLRNPKIAPIIKAGLAKEVAQSEAKLEEVLKERSKSSFIEDNYKSAEALPIESPIRPRYLDLAGRALGFIGKDGATTTHNTMIVNVDAKSLPASERWERLRSLIEGS